MNADSAPRWPPTLRPSQPTLTASPPEMAVTIRIHHRHLLLPSPKADTHFTVPWRVIGWVESRTVGMSDYWRNVACHDNRPYLRNGLTDLREIWHDDAFLASEPDRKLKFSTFKNPRWRTAAISKNGKSAIEQYLLMRILVRVKSDIHRVSKSRIICCAI